MRNLSWTITIATVRGIPIRLHLTFLVFIFALVVPSASSLWAAASELLFLIGLFGSIALHELGHAYAASFFGIKTRDIVLYPFGGIASITSLPHARGELVIALAGPLVNVLLAIILFFCLDYSEILLPDILAKLFIANIALVLFNLIPAIPMDGGRVLRALLLIGGVKSATAIASRVSQCISIIFAMIAIYFGRFDLLLVAVVVFLGAVQEQVQTQTMRAVVGRSVADAMIDAKRLESFTYATTVHDALMLALKSLQEYFPLLQGDKLRGIVSKEDLVQFAATQEANSYLREIVLTDYLTVRPDTLIESLLIPGSDSEMRQYYVVTDVNDIFLGILLREKIIELLIVDELKRRMDSEKSADQSSLI